MRIFGIQFGSSKGQVIRTESQAFNTPFLKIGKGNLALPYVQSSVSGSGVIYFGSNNLFPQTLNQMYFTSPLHSAIIDFTVNAVMGGGAKITPKIDNAANQVDIRVFQNKHKVGKTFRVLCRDYYIHQRCHLTAKYSDNGKYLYSNRVDPSQIRYRFDGAYEYCEDWSTNRNRRTIQPWKASGNVGEVIMTFQDDSPGQDYYPIPAYSSALNWCFLDGEQSFLHKSNIQNSIFPSIYIRRPKRFTSKEEQQKFIDGIKGNKGAENAGHVGVLTGDGIENTPDITPVSTNQNDKLFIQTEKSIKDNICFAHKINPSIMGIKVAGSLGNAQELEMSYNIWEKNVVMPLREVMEEIGYTLVQIADLEASFEVEGFKIIDGMVSEGTSAPTEIEGVENAIKELSEKI